MYTPWLVNYPENINAQIGEIKDDSLLDIFEQSFKRFAKHSAFVNMDKSISYAQLNTRSEQVASFLQQTLKLKRGTRVAIMMPNILQYPIVLLGILRAGLVAVNVNPLYTASELQYQLKDSGAEVIFVLKNFAHVVEKALKETAIQHVVLTALGDELPVIKGHLVNFVVTYIKKMVPNYKLENAFSYHQAKRLGAQGQYIRPAIKAEDIAFLQYTGGTTGIVKGAILTHQNMVASLMQADAFFAQAVEEGKEIIITALPLYHAFALTVNGLYFIKKGGNNILITNPRDLPTFLRTLQKYKFNYMTGLNTLFNALLQSPKFKSIDFSELRITLAGGMATQTSIANAWKKITGSTIIEGYGLTECSPMVSVNLPTLAAFNQSVGLPLSSTNVRLRDNEGQLVEQLNCAGEIEIQGPQVMQGYWNNPEETANVLVNGWLKSGDIGLFDEQGFLHLVDRKKDMILVSGFNVYPNEIENVVSQLAGIVECAVVGIDSIEKIETVKLFVVLSDQTLTVEKISEHCREYLTGYKRPKSIEIVPELPKNNVGKVLRRLLKTC